MDTIIRFQSHTQCTTIVMNVCTIGQYMYNVELNGLIK